MAAPEVGTSGRIAAAALLFALPARATDEVTARKRALEAREGFTVHFTVPALDGVSGKPLGPAEQLDALARLDSYARGYPPGFLGRYVREVIVVSDLVVDGIRARGHRNLHRVLLELEGPGGHRLDRRDFDHEVFHALDGWLGDARLDPPWSEQRERVLRLRDAWDDYRITPSRRYTFSWQDAAPRSPWFAYVPVVGLLWLAVHGGNDGEAPRGFASRWGRVAPREDRATVAEELMAGDGAFLRRAAADRELREKVAIVRAMYRVGSLGAIDDRFWAGLAGDAFAVPSLADIESRVDGERRAAARRAGTRSPAGREKPDAMPQAAAARPEPAPVGAAGPDEVPAPGAATPREPIVAVAEAVPPAPPPARTAAPPELPPPARPELPPRPAAPRTPVEAHAAALDALRAGDHVTAGRLWREMLRGVDPAYATVQISINCKLDNALANQRALAGKASFYLLPIRLQDRTCSVTLSGLYRSREEAQRAMALLPDSIRAQGPRALLVREVLHEVRD